MQTQDIVQIERRARRYWYTDGLAELAAGGVLILISLLFAGQILQLQGWNWELWLVPSFAIMVIAALFVKLRLVKALKARLTYPRTGYVASRVDQRNLNRRRLLALIVGLIIAGALVAVAQWIGSLDWLPAATGILMGLILVYLNAKGIGLLRFYILAALSVVFGLGLSFVTWPMESRLSSLYGFMGSASIISGGLTLRRYLLQNPRPTEP